MPEKTLPQSVFTFIKELKDNNNREWFNTNKPIYQEQHGYMVEFTAALYEELVKHDQLVEETAKKALFRIYRDVRFSKDKSPYKTHFSGRFKRATQLLRGGYYFHIEPENSFIAGGFWGPESKDIKRIRVELAADPDRFRSIITDPVFVETFGELKGDKVKTAPKGYSKDHPAIDLLRFKQYILVRNFTDEVVLSSQFLQQIVQTFVNMRPFLDYMSEVLTTDENGVPLFE